MKSVYDPSIYIYIYKHSFGQRQEQAWATSKKVTVASSHGVVQTQIPLKAAFSSMKLVFISA